MSGHSDAEVRLRLYHFATALLGTTAVVRALRRIERKDAALERAVFLVSYAGLASTSRALLRAIHKQQTLSVVSASEAALGTVLLTAIEHGAPPGAVGVRAYVVRHRLVPPYRAHLSQLASARLGAAPRTSGILWTRGKGVLGRCWEEGKLVLMDLAAPYAAYRDEPDTSWVTASSDVSLNLTWAEFERLATVYARLAAAPVHDAAGIVRGCVEIDVAAGCDYVLDDAVQATLAEAALVVGRALSRVHRWLYV